MQESSSYSALVRAMLFLPFVAFAGCAGMNDGEALDPTTNGLQGTWEYLVTNAYEAEFIGCTGDATVLEGATFFDALSLAPICLAGVTLDANQDGESFEVLSHQVTCSDGAEASVSALGEVTELGIGGQWESVSDQGVSAVQIFSGEISGDTIELTETRRIFDGDFQGVCDLAPPLTAIVTVR